MSVQKILPIARKMGEVNFQTYKSYIKNAKTLKSGEFVRANFLLRGMTIVDTINFTLKDNEKFDIEGFRSLLREIHKRYFPRANDKDAEKRVTMTFGKYADDHTKTTVVVQTDIDKNMEGVGRSFYEIVKKGKELAVDIKTGCEDFWLNLQAEANLKDANINKKQNMQINANLYRDLKAEEKGENVIFSLKATPNKDVPKFELEAGISKAKLEDMFNGGLEQALPDLVMKSGIKFDF